MRGALLVSVLLVLAASAPILANPIPVPTLVMNEEYIDVLLDVGAGRVVVNATYPFENVGYREACFYYPVPRGAAVKVWMREEPVKWSYAGPRDKYHRYEAADGEEYPVIKWCSRLPTAHSSFNVSVLYEAPMNSVEGGLQTLYALGSWGLLAGYVKQAHAYIDIRVVGGEGVLEARLAGGEAATGYILARHRAGDGDTLHLVVVSPMFHPVDKDLIIRLEPPRGSGWRPYTPGMGEALLEAEWRGGRLFIELDLSLRHAGFSVEWGDPRVSGGTILLDVSLREYTGPAAQVVTHRSHTYIVEGLDSSRTYVVELRFNGERYASMAVPPPSTPSPGSSTSTTVIDTTPPAATRPAGPGQASALTVTVTRTAAPTLGLALVAALAVGVAIGFLARRG